MAVGSNPRRWASNGPPQKGQKGRPTEVNHISLIMRHGRSGSAGRAARSRTCILLLLVCLSLLVTDCQGTPYPPTAMNTVNLGDGGLLSQVPCRPPCFFGVTPGISTRIDAEQALQHYGLDRNCKYFDSTRDGGVRGVTCDAVVIELQSGSDIVSGIGFQPSLSITVGDVVARHGAPSTVGVAAVGLTDRYPIITGATLYFDSIHAALGLAEQSSGGEFNLQPATRVLGISYEDQATYDHERGYTAAWKGYGIYPQWNP